MYLAAVCFEWGPRVFDEKDSGQAVANCLTPWSNGGLQEPGRGAGQQKSTYLLVWISVFQSPNPRGAW